jgi:hypothetical protein
MHELIAGVHGTISVLGPPMPREQGPHASRRWMAPDASEVTFEEYEHPAMPRKLAERNPDSRYIGLWFMFIADQLLARLMIAEHWAYVWVTRNLLSRSWCCL